MTKFIEIGQKKKKKNPAVDSSVITGCFKKPLWNRGICLVHLCGRLVCGPLQYSGIDVKCRPILHMAIAV